MHTVGGRPEALELNGSRVASIIYRCGPHPIGKPVGSLSNPVTDMPVPFINSAGVQYVREHLENFPRPDREAAQAIRDWASSNGLALDPDQIDVVTLHYRPDGPQGYQALIRQRLSLTQAVLGNWQGESNNDAIGALFSAPWAGTLPNGPIKIVEHLTPLGPFDNSAAFEVFNGLFQRTDPMRYEPATQVHIPAEKFQRFIEKLDFHSHYRAQLDRYWQQHLDSHRLSNKLNFIAACNKQVSEGSLSDTARKLVWRAARLIPRGRKLRLSTLTVYGYAATDLLFINDGKTDLSLLYLPGNSSPFLEFANQNLLKDWFGEQCQSSTKRQALKQYFNLADGPDGLDFSGLDTALAGMGDYPAVHRLSSDRPGFTTDGRWSPRDYVNYRPVKYNPPLTGDLFMAVTLRQQQRSYADADFIITSNSEVTKAKWRGYLTSALNLLMPMTFVIPGLAPLLALGGIAQLGLGLDQAINGKTLEAKADGVSNIVYGLFNATPLAVAGLTKSAEVFRVKADGFVLPSRVNDQIGYPLSPGDPPRLPEMDVALYFHSPDPTAPLDELPSRASPVSRIPQYTGMPDRLSAVKIIEGNFLVELELVYDMEFDLFIEQSRLNEVDASYYEATPGEFAVKRADPHARTVTNPMRITTLRSLGVDLPIPVELPVPIRGEAIPKTITSLWVGDKVIDTELLENVVKNAKRLKGSAYQYRLYLSNADAVAHTENLRLLKSKAPDLQVHTLEEQPFFISFKQSKYFAQYQDALDGNAGVATNYPSACDVLRYPMLHHEGGLYMDLDDELLAPSGSRLGCIGAGACVAEAIDEVELATSKNGLLLHPAMSNEKLGMHFQYNTSMIGSHPGNPTLVAISDEMHARYQNEPDFYRTKPSLVEDPTGFYEYASRLNRLTGPALFTDVVDRLLPDLYRLRQLRKLYGMPHTKSWLYVSLQAWMLVEKEALPLSRFAKVGGQHAWINT